MLILDLIRLVKLARLQTENVHIHSLYKEGHRAGVEGLEEEL